MNISTESSTEAKRRDAVTQKAAKRNVKAIVLPIPKEVRKRIEKVDQKPSQEASEDPFRVLTEDGQIIEPPFDMLTLAMMHEHSTELGQCFSAMETNIEAFGYRFVPRASEDDLKNDSNLRAKVDQERVDLENHFDYACLESSFVEFRRQQRVDLESTGNAWFEIIRGVDGSVQGYNHLPAYQMRLGIMPERQTKVKVPILKKKIDGQVEKDSILAWRRFRMHVQSRSVYSAGRLHMDGYATRWFKTFGDPDEYDCETGRKLPKEEIDQAKQECRLASEVIHRRIYSARSPYGLPRYIGNMLSLFGDRAAEEINYMTFQSNNIPSMIVSVSNGQLTEGTINRINDFVESQIQASKNYSKFLIVEGEPYGDDDLGAEDMGNVKIDIKPLVSEQHKDALFQNYSKGNQDKIRRSFRLPPLLVGRTDVYTRATVEASRKMADEQIFAPERDVFDNIINRIIFPVMGVLYHKFKSNSPNTTDNTELVKILAGAEKTGGMTPRIARMMLEDILGIELPEFPDGFPAELPFSLAMAEAVKNKADPAEPGQQVTALKAIESLTGVDGSFTALSGEEIVEKLMDVRKRLDGEWRKQVDENSDVEHGHEEELDEL